MKEARIEIYGRVQGVGFRMKVRKFARILKLRGCVLNLANGGSLIVVQGREKKIDDMISWLEGSPGFSKVEKMDVDLGGAVSAYKEFKIMREGNFIFDSLKGSFNLFRRIFSREVKIVNVPKHVVIIPDGNRRWARHRGLEPHFGHYKAGSYSSVESLFKEAKKLGIECVSVWGFSTENWKRDDGEKKAIFDLILGGAERFRKDAGKNKIRFRHVGRKDRLPKKLVYVLERLEKETEEYGNFTVQLCLDYGGRDEIVRAVNKVIKSGRKEIKEEEFSGFLDTAGVLDPDLIIRTSGEKRLSGMMPFQSVYAELYFSKIFFPEFGGRELRRAVRAYSKRVRRFGGDNV